VWDTLIVNNLYVLDQLIGGGGGVAEPQYQVVYGTGPAVDSHEEFKFFYDTTQTVIVGDLDTPISRLNLEGTGTPAYDGLAVMNTEANTTPKGGIAVVGPRYNTANLPFVGFTTWDDGSERSIEVGGGGWSRPDASVYRLYVAPAYSETADTGVLAFRQTLRVTSSRPSQLQQCP
jgi:hypothetical protein